MTHIRPFSALRPPQNIAAQVASRPYDVLSVPEAIKEAENNPYSFLHVTRSEIDLPEGTDVHAKEVYDKAAENLKKMIAGGTLVQENKPCYYIYRLIMNGRSQTGLVCLSSVEDYQNGLIKKHEFTRPEKEKDRIDHMLAIGAQTGNVFLACADEPGFTTFLNQYSEGKPEYDFTASDGIQHTVWVVSDEDQVHKLTVLFDTMIPATYIADGHHRAASAAKVAASLNGNEQAQWFLTTIFPASELAILDYNRLIKDLNGHSEEEFLALLNKDFVVTASSEAVKPSNLHEFGLYLGGKWVKLAAKPGTWTDDPLGVLDINILQNRLLDPILGIKDQRSDPRIDFVGGIRGMAELEKRVNSGDWKLAFSLYPVSIQQLFDIADSGNVMPPKSTWFEPKLRDGLLTHKFA